MPELPEVQTTVVGLRRLIGTTITDVWTDMFSKVYIGGPQIKDRAYFKKFKEDIIGGKIDRVERRGKNILIHINNGYTILAHMKMTGHFLYGKYSPVYKKNKIIVWKPQEPASLHDPFNRFVHMVFSLSNGKHLAFCDMRKFGKIFHCQTDCVEDHTDIRKIGPEPLDKTFTYKEFYERLSTKPSSPIKSVLMDQCVVAGIGNIYSDEILWSANIHPLSCVRNIERKYLQQAFKAMKLLLAKGIDFGGDSMSDYRNIDGLPGRFQSQHNAYRLAGKRCKRNRCDGMIERMVIGGRSTHFCPKHQKFFNPKKKLV